jgi:hypothetical protein
MKKGKVSTWNGPELASAMHHQASLQAPSNQLQIPQVCCNQQDKLSNQLYNLQFPPLGTNMITTNQTQPLQSNQQVQPAHMFNVNTNQIFSPTQPCISNHRSDVAWSSEYDHDIA